MKIYVDLHIHTALSPCGDEDMTPNNIINMAKLKGLDAIAITDHNSCKNVLPCMKVGEKNGVLVVPAMELQTREEIHILCYFREIESSLKFEKLIYESLPPIKNNERLFGEQIIMNESDNKIGKEEKLLLSSSSFSLDEACKLVRNLGGIIVPAHIESSSFGLLGNLGFIPEYLNISTVEVKNIDKLREYKYAEGIESEYRIIKSSDAHYLWDILERENEIKVNEISIDNIMKVL